MAKKMMSNRKIQISLHAPCQIDWNQIFYGRYIYIIWYMKVIDWLVQDSQDKFWWYKVVENHQHRVEHKQGSDNIRHVINFTCIRTLIVLFEFLTF